MNTIPKVLAEVSLGHYNRISIQESLVNLNDQSCFAMGRVNYILNDLRFDTGTISDYQIGLLTFGNDDKRIQFSANSLGINKDQGILSKEEENIGLVALTNHKFDKNPSDITDRNYDPTIGDIIGLELNPSNKYIKNIYTFEGKTSIDVPNISNISKNLELPICDFIIYSKDSKIISPLIKTDSNYTHDGHIYYISGIILLILVIGVLIFKLTKKDKSI